MFDLRKQRIEEEASGARLTGEDREELLRLRKEVKKLRIEKEILLGALGVKKASAYFAKEVKFKAIAEWEELYPIIDLCRVLRVSTGAYYHWKRNPVKIISEEELYLYREVKRLFNQIRSGIGYVKLTQALQRSGFIIGETKTRSIMRKLGLVCTQRLRYKSTTNSNHKLGISDNVLNQQFNPESENQVWSTDITYLKTLQGWIYLVVVMDLYLSLIHI